MSQADLNIDNVSRSLFRAEVNQSLQALASLNAGATAPSTTYAYQLWADTTTGILKMRNAANSAWVELFKLDVSDLVKIGANSTITSLSGLTTPLSEAQGGTGTSSGNMMFKNRIINGAMMIDQRNAGASKSYSSATITYAVDRFFLYPSGAAVTGQQVAGTNTGTQYAFRITGATGSTAVNFSQRIENLNVTDLNSIAVTISAKIYASTSISNIAFTVFCGTSANSGYGSGNNVSSSTFSLASGLNTITQTITLPSTASNGFEIALVFNSGIGNGVSVDISSIQLEKGSTATSFDYRPYGTELVLCQRYYWRSTQSSGGNGGLGFAIGNGTNYGRWQFNFPVQMRTTPTIGFSGLTLFNFSTSQTLNSITGNYSTVNNISVDGSAAGSVGTNTMLLIYQNNASSYADASAEL